MHEEATAGLNPQDEQRARSMADEGGVSAAVVEAEEARPLPAGSLSKALVACAVAAACGAAAAVWWFRR